MRRRSNLEMYIEVLKIIKKGTEKPTRIMSEANLSWSALKKILKTLMSQDFISEMDASDSRDKRTKRRYRLTQKGENVIKHFLHTKKIVELKDLDFIRERK